MIWVLYVLIGTGIGVCVCVSVWDSSVCVCLQNVIPSISITVAAFFWATPVAYARPLARD